MRTQLNQSQPKPQQPEHKYNRGNRPSNRHRSGRHIERPEWIKVDRITVEEAEKSVRIRFPGKPEDHEREILKKNGFIWSGWSGFWYARKTDAALEFARNLEENGFTVDPAHIVGADI